MPMILEEQFQRFTFDDTWTVFRYDCAESGYFGVRDGVPGSRACDFAGVRSATGYLIEVKDFRGYRIQTKARMADGELAVEVAQKVRDTLAGIVSGVRRSDTERPWTEMLIHRLGQPQGQVVIVLALEDDTAADGRRWKQRLSTLTNELKAKLHWLRARVSVVSPQTFPGSMPGVVVTNLPGACGYAAHTP
ncbi:MAG: hypothetical protein HY735_27715 [Verrucomicrobia bacterium]|nr:hypothetical protein [Verrucomicrobiota bacterium]